MIPTQTAAIFLDAYRELNAKKLFWITMGLNLLAVIVFASAGINQNGITFWHWQLMDNPFFNSENVSPELFYKTQFTSWGIPIWLSWATIILALVSTAGIIPDLISSGMIEPVLSKPIGRVRLFLTKFFTGLLFVGLQVTVFSVGALLVIGIRGGAWELKLLLAIPIVLALFSYLFSFCALMGLITRSTIASLLITMLLWFIIWIVNLGDGFMLAQREGSRLRAEDREAMVEKQTELAEKLRDQRRQEGEPVPGEGDTPVPEGFEDPLEAINPSLRRARTRLEDARETADSSARWAGRVIMLKTIFPKTQETVGLLERYLISQKELNELMGMSQPDEPENLDDMPPMADPRASERVAQILRARSLGWILGTSFAFEFIMLALCSWIFARRDF